VLTLEGKAALITGAGRGIGRATALLFGRLGARVAVNYVRDAAAAEATASEIRAAGGDAAALQADVSDHDAAGRLVDAAVERFGGLDILVVNHGIWKRGGPVHEMTPEAWDETLRVNLRGAYSVCHHAAKVMIPRRSGVIVLLASTSGQRGEASYSHYSATKGALLSFTKSLAAELAPHGIRVSGVAPGWVMTDMSRNALAANPASAYAAIPLGRVATPEEIAGPIAFLASDLASYLHGEILCVNGGAVMAE